MNDAFLAACRGEEVERIPVWFMRQAGRSLPGYKKLREKYGVLEITKTPTLAAQVALEPVERFGVDAAVLFADIMLLPESMGVELELVDGVGPIIKEPIDAPGEIARISKFSSKRTEFLVETIQILRKELRVPLIGFSGAPFTLASYLIEGKPSREWAATRRFMREQPQAWDDLMEKLSDGIIEYLQMQISAGVQAVQLFDSWAGCLSPEEYRAQVLPHTKRIFAALKASGVSRIHFGTGTGKFLEDFASVDCEVIGVDWRVSLADAKQRVGAKALQGNLDPALLLAEEPALYRAVDEMLAHIHPKQGYIFNLGHRLPLDADNTVVKNLVDYVHAK